MVIVYAAPSDVLRLGQDVDVEGTLDTLPNGLRVITNPRVIGYYNESGSLLQQCPPTKSLPGFTAPWQWKADLPPATDPDPTGQPVPGEPNLALPPPPVPHDTVASLLQDAVLGTSAALECKKVIDKGNDPVLGDYLIIGDDHSSSAVKIYVGSNSQSEETQSLGAVSAGATSTAQADDTQTQRVNNVSGQVQLVGTQLALVLDGSPNFDTQGLPGDLQTVDGGTIAYAKSLADSSTASRSLACRSVAAQSLADSPTTNIQNVIVIDYDPASKVAYVENADRSAGMRIDCSGNQAVESGSVVTVEGTLQTTSDGERELYLTSPAVKSSADKVTLNPLGMTNLSLGGSDFNKLTPGVNYPLPGSGLYNKGLLVKIWGCVTAVDELAGYFYIDDGSKVSDYGVKVAWNAQGGVSSLPAVGEYVAGIVGISSSEEVGPNQYARLLRLRYLARPVVTGTALSHLAVLSWAPQDQASYRVYRGDSESGPFSLVATVSGGQFSDTGLINGQTYYYEVCSVDSAIAGAMSQVVDLTPTGGATTVTSEVDSTTSTYSYTVRLSRQQRVCVRSS